jgi:hypothetical protein
MKFGLLLEVCNMTENVEHIASSQGQVWFLLEVFLTENLKCQDVVFSTRFFCCVVAAALVSK